MDVAKLNEYAQRERLELKYEDVRSVGPDHIKTFTVRAVVNGKAYPDGEGKTKKEAKQKAAKNALRVLSGESNDSVSVCKTPERAEEKRSNAPTKKEEELNQSVSDIIENTKSLSVITTDEGFAETNFIGMINIHCQKNNLPHVFILDKKCGPPHNPQFFYKLVINNKDYPVGEGKNIKEAKQQAAQLAWSALRPQTDLDSKGSSCPADDGAPARLSTPPSILESHNAKSKPVPATTSDSVVFMNPSNPPKIQSPDAKPKIRIAANFQNVHKKSKEEVANFNDKNTGNSHSKKPTSPTTSSRFTSEFDNIVRLGKGAFGRVFKAKQKLLRKDYAVKIVRCKEMKKALREAMALSDLHHRNIVRYYSCWLEDTEYQWDSAEDSGSTSQSTVNSLVKFLYIQMELCDTKTLRVWIDEKNILNVKKSLRDSKRRDESLAITQEIVSAVEYIHSKMLIHRDLKPANIMFGQEGEVKIGDFGLVTEENDDDAENLMERTVYKGTPSYMAPEQRSRSTYDRKVDIFALGLIYFELLWNICTGLERKPVWDDARNLKLPQEFAKHFPSESRIIKLMLCEKPDDRPEASKLKTDLEEYARSLTTLKEMRRYSKTY
ncbi:interferon-induced, double-stranded RNA-activated protein kinase-like isoform X2 [Plectropomus leopardus]|uniref:interferon-induced, double-stranded RNA-activated protein kinase-like isoform X2 n=1 Tax=Plectropomus leopardus TaxID=160734 RepID=UPI001C4D5EA7|nr:interferon-induced, double-stranded RNA-activated protein kinase-like isoform X2 [Plectropomus leopardus]